LPVLPQKLSGIIVEANGKENQRKRRGREKKDATEFLKKINPKLSIKKGIAISCKIVYSKREQSKRQRVKCHRDGEFARRTKVFSTMLSLHPLLHMGITSFM